MEVVVLYVQRVGGRAHLDVASTATSTSDRLDTCVPADERTATDTAVRVLARTICDLHFIWNSGGTEDIAVNL